jgi:hypothetical protein
MEKPKGAAIKRPILIDRRSIEVFQACDELGPTILAALNIYVQTGGARNIGMQ